MPARFWQILRNHTWLLCLPAAGLFLAFVKLPGWLRWPARITLVVLILMIASSLALKIHAMARQPRKTLFTLVALLFGLGVSYGCVELLCWAHLRTRPDLSASPFELPAQQRKSVEDMMRGDGTYLQYSPTLGWTLQKNGTSPDGLYHANAAGFRATREYARQKPPGTVRAMCYGDSFTHCQDVADADTWASRAEQASRGLECLNFGVPGFGLTQAFVRYRETASAFDADYVIIGCMTEDIRRSVNAWYPYRFLHPQDAPSAVAMPYASLDASGALQVHPPVLGDLDAYRQLLANPEPQLRRLAALDILFSPPPATPFLTVLEDRMNSTSIQNLMTAAGDNLAKTWHAVCNARQEGKKHKSAVQSPSFSPGGPIFETNCRLFLRFISDVRATGATPVVLWFPGPADIQRHNEGREPIYTAFLQFFASHHETCLDVLDWIKESHPKDQPLPMKEIFGRDHFSAETNRLIGRRIAAFIQEHPAPPKAS